VIKLANYSSLNAMKTVMLVIFMIYRILRNKTLKAAIYTFIDRSFNSY